MNAQARRAACAGVLVAALVAVPVLVVPVREAAMEAGHAVSLAEDVAALAGGGSTEGSGQPADAENDAHAGAFAGLPALQVGDTSDAVERDAESIPVRVFELVGGRLPDGELPARFVEELFDPVHAGPSEVRAQGNVVGMVCEGDEKTVRKRIAALLAASGWARGADDGESRGDLYVKREGTCRWAYVVCQTVSGSTAVTMVVGA